MPRVETTVETEPSCGDASCVICGANRITINDEYFARIRRERDAADRARLVAQRRAQREREKLASLNVANDEDIPRGASIGCTCEACKYKKGEASAIRRDVIHEYSYMPRLNFMSVPDDKYDYFLGIELETDDHNREVDSSEAASIRLPKRMWYPKHDGSVTGPEFVSHPATLSYWQAMRPKLQEMFDTLRHAGYSSHNGGHCGMHINISRKAFDKNGVRSADHIFRFLTLLTHSTEWSLTMSQRTFNQMQSWATMHGYTTPEERRRMAEQMARPGGSNGLGHGSMLGTPHDGDRFEFRLPRGTLRLDRFFMKMQWTVAMIEYTRTNKAMRNMTPKKFMQWVVETQANEYPDLVEFINEKFAATPTEAVGEQG